jgi:hypothetical protein
VTDGAISPHPGHEKKIRQAKAFSLEKTYRIHAQRILGKPKSKRYARIIPE